MARWQDQQEVVSCDAISHMYLGDGLSAEIEIIYEEDSKMMYRLTIGSLFASESVRFPYTQKGLEDLLKTLAVARGSDKAVKPIGGTLEPREYRKEELNER